MTAMHVTFGIIARNGMPFIGDCLEALPAARTVADSSEVILVDCISDDGTTEAMQDYAASAPRVQLYRIDGEANAAVARNVILANTATGALLLLDGDIVANPGFIAAAIALVQEGRADAVVGDLSEVQHDAEMRPLRHIERRFAVEREGLVRISGGTIFLAPQVVAAGLRYDERFRRNQDRDFALRLSSEFRLMQVTESMGCHLTQAYLHPSRIGRFFREAYPRPLGQLLRKHWRHPGRLAAVLRKETGMVVGSLYLLLLAGSLLAGLFWLTGLVGAAVLVDVLRFARQRRLNEFLPLRLFTPLFVLRGLLGPAEPVPQYRVTRLH